MIKIISKILLIVLLASITRSGVKAQIKDPVKWSYALKKLKGGLYELYMLASIEPGWHIYAQKQSQDAIAIPTSFKFDQVSGLVLLGVVEEAGKKEVQVVKELGISSVEYSGKVDFVQKIQIKEGIDRIKGAVTFQACTKKECLPEKTVEFNIPVKQ